MLNGKKVVVVGGSSGIGLATAALCKAQGARVTIASRSRQKLDAAGAQIGVDAREVDVTNDASVEGLFTALGEVDHVVVSAAQLRAGPFKTQSMDDARATMESKFWGAWRVARAARFAAGGSLTLVSGFLSVRPRPNSAIVGAANGALDALARSLAIDLAPVRVNAVSPGIIDTPIRAAMPEQARRALLDQVAAALPVRRVGTGEDVAQQIVAYMSNGFATGAITYIDGGGSIA